MRDGFEIRRAAVERRIPCFTSLDTARAAVESLLMSQDGYSIRRTEEYLTDPDRGRPSIERPTAPPQTFRERFPEAV